MNLKVLTTLLLILITLAACGKKGPVRPKLQPLPAAPANLTIEQRGERFLLAWDIPRTNQDGSPFEPQSFRILRMQYHPAEDCAGCRSDFSLAREVDLNYLQGVRRSGERLFWWDDTPRLGYAYRYQVVATTTTAAGRAGAPAQAQRLFVEPPLPPQNLQATGLDQMIRLAWEAPAENGKPAGFRIYRWEPEAPMALEPIDERQDSEFAYDDFGRENGRTYFYTVTTIAEISGQRVESMPTEPVAAVPQAGK